jgi:hypothetical protein
VSGVTVVNVYKPPSSNWSSNTFKVFPHPTIYVADFHSQNQLWGYEHNNTEGNRLLEWMTLNKIYLMYNPKDKGTFHSARWRKDLSMIIQDAEVMT